MMENKIIIKIVGGLVDCVYSNLESLDIEVLDEDVMDDDYEEKERVLLRKETERLIAHHR